MVTGLTSPSIRGTGGRVARRGPGRPRIAGLRDRRREEILAVATQEFARRGYPGTDLQNVADLLGVGKGTVYRYFDSKEELFLAAADRGMRLLQEDNQREAVKGRDPVDQIVRATHAYLRFFDRHPELVELIVQERAEFRNRKRPTYFAHRDVNIKPWRKLLHGLIAAGRIRKIPVDRITDVFSSVLYGAIFTNYFENRRRSPERQAEDILDVIFCGIEAPLLNRPRSKKGASP
jgi:AcrR family transcriptional regulator